jgi:hypothetical protein
MAHLSRRAVLIAAAALSAFGGCGGERRVETADAARCLAADDIATAQRGDPEAATDVLAFEIPSEPTPTRGLLIFVADADDAEKLEAEIAAEAKAQGHEAVLLRERNVIAHFLARNGPTAEERDRIRRCLEPS